MKRNRSDYLLLKMSDPLQGSKFGIHQNYLLHHGFSDGNFPSLRVHDSGAMEVGHSAAMAR